MSDAEYSDDGEEFVYDDDEDDEYVYEEEEGDGVATGAGGIPDAPSLMRQASVSIADVDSMEVEMRKVRSRRLRPSAKLLAWLRPDLLRRR